MAEQATAGDHLARAESARSAHIDARMAELEGAAPALEAARARWEEAKALLREATTLMKRDLDHCYEVFCDAERRAEAAVAERKALEAERARLQKAG